MLRRCLPIEMAVNEKWFRSLACRFVGKRCAAYGGDLLRRLSHAYPRPAGRSSRSRGSDRCGAAERDLSLASPRRRLPGKESMMFQNKKMCAAQRVAMMAEAQARIQDRFLKIAAATGAPGSDGNPRLTVGQRGQDALRHVHADLTPCRLRYLAMVELKRSIETVAEYRVLERRRLQRDAVEPALSGRGMRSAGFNDRKVDDE